MVHAMTERERPRWAVRLQRERESRGWSKAEMARQLKYAIGSDATPLESLTRQVRDWEKGRHFPRDWATAYAAAFGFDELDLFPAQPERDEQPDLGHDVLRRELDEALAAGAMSEATLDDWELTVLRHGAAARDRPAGSLIHDLAADLEDLRTAVDRRRSASALRRLTRVTAHMAGLMCLTLIKLDDRTAFRRWARTGRIAAAEAGDPVTRSWVLAQESYGHFYAGDFQEAINVAQGAQEADQRCVGAVLAAALEARARAALGPAQDAATRAALTRAEELLADLPSAEVNTSAFGYTEAQLRFHAGNAFTHLGDTEAAWAQQHRALQLCPQGDYMDRALTRLDRTLCLVRDGDVVGALEYATETVAPLTEQQRQGIIALRSRDVLGALSRRQAALPAARELREFFTSSISREAEHP